MSNLFRILGRYVLLLIIIIMVYTLPAYNLLFYLTALPVNFLINLFYPSFIFLGSLLVEGLNIELIPACIAISAYVLLIILNLSTAMNSKQRIYSLLFSLFSLLALNIIRIFILTFLLLNNAVYFEAIHKIFWYGLSTLFVVGIWFASAYLFKIKNIPVYSDAKTIIKQIKLSKNK